MKNFIGKRFWFLISGGAYLIFALVSLGVFGLKPSIELTSGSLLTVHFSETVTETGLKQELSTLGYTDTIVQETGQGDFLIRTSTLTDQAKTDLENGLTARFGPTTQAEFATVSPLVAAETLRNAVIAIGAAIGGMLIYIIWAFRKMPKPARYGACAIIGLAHDAVVALGFFALMGYFQGWQIDIMFITGILAVIGYSINSTVVVFDRIRENVLKGINPDFATTVNISINETLTRNLNTGLTTVLTITALIFFVGASIQNLAWVLLLGVVAGTYGSSFLATSLLVVWERGEGGRLIGRNAPKTAGAVAPAR